MQAAQYNERLARKVSRVRSQIDAVDDEYSALLSQPPSDVACDMGHVGEASQCLQEEAQLLPDELDSWVQEANGKMSAVQKRLQKPPKLWPVNNAPKSSQSRLKPVQTRCDVLR